MRIPSNKVSDIFRFAYQELGSIYLKEEIDSFMFIFFEEFLGWNKAKVLSNKEKNINQSDLLKFNFGIKDLKKEKPIQYIIGKTCFYGFDFLVNPSTLIPRPETEELVSLIIEENKSKKELSILDIGTGSGCIPISLARNLNTSDVYAIDISGEALQVATRNASNHKTLIHFIEADILAVQDVILPEFDIIVSNPPYVCDSEKKAMKKNVLDYEPSTALFVSDNYPLIFYDVISSFALNHLKSEGRLYFEINERFGEQMKQLLESKGFSVEVIKDLYGKDRMCSAYLKSK